MNREERAKRKQLIIDALRKGDDLEDVASRYDVSIGTAKKYGYEAGISLRQQKTARDLEREVKDLLESGLSIEEVADKVDRPIRYVRVVGNRYGLFIKGRDMIYRILGELKKGKTQAEIGREVGKSREYIRQIAQKAKTYGVL